MKEKSGTELNWMIGLLDQAEMIRSDLDALILTLDKVLIERQARQIKPPVDFL